VDERNAKHFLRKVHKNPITGCWEWLGARNPDTYGIYHGKLAHVVSYTLFKGPIPEGYVLDHLCRIRFCVNPEHLEAVTPEENVRRGKAGVLRCEPDLPPVVVMKRRSGEPLAQGEAFKQSQEHLKQLQQEEQRKIHADRRPGEDDDDVRARWRAEALPEGEREAFWAEHRRRKAEWEAKLARAVGFRPSKSRRSLADWVRTASPDEWRAVTFLFIAAYMAYSLVSILVAIIISGC